MGSVWMATGHWNTECIKGYTGKGKCKYGTVLHLKFGLVPTLTQDQLPNKMCVSVAYEYL